MDADGEREAPLPRGSEDFEDGIQRFSKIRCAFPRCGYIAGEKGESEEEGWIRISTPGIEPLYFCPRHELTIGTVKLGIATVETYLFKNAHPHTEGEEVPECLGRFSEEEDICMKGCGYLADCRREAERRVLAEALVARDPERRVIRIRRT